MLNLKNEKTVKPIDVFSDEFWNRIEEERFGKKRIAKNTKEYLSNNDYYKLFQMKNPRIGDSVEGFIVSANNKDILVDFGYKDYVRVDTKSSLEYITNLHINDNVKVMIKDIKDNPYQIIGSIADIAEKEAVDKLKSSFNEIPQLCKPLLCHVDEIIPAGYHVTIYVNESKFRGFMPNIQAGINRVFNPKELLNKDIYVMLETLQCDKNIYIVSRRKYLQQQIPIETKKLKRNQVYAGRVTGCKNYGVFVEFNDCLTCLIHKDNLDPMYHPNLEAMNIPNDTQIEFYIAEVDENNKRIIGSQYYIETVFDKINVGDEMDGTIVNTYSLGYLVNFGKDANGFAMTKNIQSKNKVYNIGDKVKVKILSFNKDEQQSMLSIL